MSHSEKPQPTTADDPELTAFALGELEGAAQAHYAAAVAASPELQAIVAEIQADALMLTSELRSEPAVPLPAERRAEIIAQVPRPRPVPTAPRLILGLTQRTAAITAASVLLAPGVWYAFQTAFPRPSRAPLQAIADRPAESNDYYLRDHVQYPSAMSHPQSEARQAPTSFSVYSDQSPEQVAEHSGQITINSGSEPAGKPFAATSRPVGRTAAQREGQKAAERADVEYDIAASTDGQPQRHDFDPKLAEHSGSSNQSGQPSSQLPKLSVSASAQALGESESAPEAKPRSANLATDERTLDLRYSEKHLTQLNPQPGVKDQLARGRANATLARGLGTKELGDQMALAESLHEEARNLGREGKYPSAPLGWAKPELKWHDGEFRQEALTAESYTPIYENAFISAAEQQLSTFSIDVDTASYSNLRRFLQSGQLPPPDAVRVEELVNYFAYQYPQPQDGRPFSVQSDIAACPWQPGHQLVRIGLKGKEIPKEQRPPTNLVFLVDVSGSMSANNKLPLVRESLKTLVQQLDERDKIAIVTYAGEAGVRLPSTSLTQRETIISAIDGLGAGGSTNGAAGINTAYDIAAQQFLDKGTNRVILCTDGDFNVGVTSDDALVEMIQTRAKGGVFLSIFGFGMGNLKDAKLEQLADKGNGQYGYIDDQLEANKVFIEEMMGTLVTIAKDVKIQVEFDSVTVKSYRLIGYENRVMAAEDFHNDKKDAGEIGSGHTVTALYEIVPNKDSWSDDQTRWLTVKLRYKQPEASESVLFESPLIGIPGQLKLASSDFQFATAVAATGMLLRHSQHAGQANWALVKELAQSGLSHDPHGHRRAFLGLVGQAESLMGQQRPVSPAAPDSTVRGKYKSLLRKLNAPEDTAKYGQFNDFGFAETKSYAGSDNLPAGYWVYVAPHWYIWAESTQVVKN